VPREFHDKPALIFVANSSFVGLANFELKTLRKTQRIVANCLGMSFSAVVAAQEGCELVLGKFSFEHMRKGEDAVQSMNPNAYYAILGGM
jgi:hypothetical protein